MQYYTISVDNASL